MSEITRASELNFLRWFASHADFGPADGDVRDALSEEFMDETGQYLPEGWNLYQDGETSTDNYLDGLLEEGGEE
jgi:hypothetical protein